MGKFFKIAKRVSREDQPYPKDVHHTPSPHVFWKTLMPRIGFSDWGSDAVKTKGMGAAVERVLPFGKSGRHWPLKKNEELKKVTGIKGAIQRTLPGGKSGFEVHEKVGSLGRKTKPVSSPKAPPIPKAPVNIKASRMSIKPLTTKSKSGLNKKAAIRLHDWDYLKYLLSHKANMWGPGRDIGVSRKTLLMHDMDKFQPNRFRQYSDWFFGPEGVKGTKNPELKKRWRQTVDEHYANNLHHAHKLDKEQPLENQLEALVDWYSVTKSTGKTTLRFFDW